MPGARRHYGLFPTLRGDAARELAGGSGLAPLY
ncbi:hypothetical protein FHW94_000277 [Novosphingobium sp. SG720]|nr:hypothetical protein [Novosphingobium sp. SG720]